MTESKFQTGLYLRDTVEYDAIDAVRFSTLKHMATSPKHYRYRKRKPKPPTRGMQLGTSAHTAVLEPDHFLTDYVLYTGNKKKGSIEWKDFVAANPGKTVIQKPEYMKAIAIRDSVRSDKFAKRYLETGYPEIAMVWRDEETGILCKGRVDWLCEDPKDVLADLKSSARIDEFRFCRTASELIYDAQCAFYFDGYKAAVLKEPQFKVIAVEQEEPHDVAVYDVPEETLDVGREMYRNWLVKLQQCERSGDWHGIAQGELLFTLPPWRMGDENDTSGLGLTGWKDE